MSKFRVVGTVFVLAVAGLAIWVAGSGMRSGRTGSARNDAPDAAYDYLAKDVIVRQMGPDGSLQYELSAKQITQQSKNGQIAAQDLVMHRDPPGSEPGGPNRWTLRADHANLPESGGNLALQGNVHGEGRPKNSLVLVTVDGEELKYNLVTEEVCSSKPVDVTWGRNSTNVESLCMDTRSGDFNTGALKVNSVNVAAAPN